MNFLRTSFIVVQKAKNSIGFVSSGWGIMVSRCGVGFGYFSVFQTFRGLGFPVVVILISEN